MIVVVQSCHHWPRSSPARLDRAISALPIIGNLYYVGSKGLASYLITTPQGTS